MPPLRTLIRSCFLVVALVLPFIGVAEAESLHFRFIGNQAFEITDGETTLLSDFPYQPGYAGYMRYAEKEIHRRENAICLITHRHLDHFDPSLVKKVGCTLVAPKEVTSKLPGVPSLDLKEGVRFGPIGIHPVRTPHRGLEHYSYLVTWQGRRLYFVGDTTSYEALVATEDLDVLFVTPWLANNTLRAGRQLPGDKRVIYHHKPREEVPACRDCVVPKQGDGFEIPAGN